MSEPMRGMGVDAKKHHGAGKGAAPRKGAQNAKYRANFDKIFRKDKSEADKDAQA